MGIATTFFFFLILVTGSAAAQTVDAGQSIVDCTNGDSLADAVAKAAPDSTLFIEGVCLGPVTIARNGLTLRALGSATVNGQGKTAITVNGASRVTLNGLQVTGGSSGVVGQSGAQLTLKNVNLTQNSLFGLLLQNNSSAQLLGGSATNNGLNGIDAESTSSLTFTGPYTVSGNAVFGINVNSTSSMTLIAAQVSVTQNTLGIQIGTSASAFISDSTCTLTVSNNQTTGLTIVSGSHLVAFGGKITTTGNGIHGISVDSKAGLDLDAAALVTSSQNQQDGVHLEETSVLTMFNTPAFSGAPGTTTLVTTNNVGNGIGIETGSSVTLINQAAIQSSNNTLAGIAADNGSSVSILGSTLQGNHPDLILTFGSRASLTTSTIGAISCDASTLVRGDTGTTCPSAKH